MHSIEGIEIPSDIINNNTVRDACMRLRDAIELGFGVERARADLLSWIEHAQQMNLRRQEGQPDNKETP